MNEAQAPAGREAAVLGGVFQARPSGVSRGKDSIGSALSVAQFGGKHPATKPWKGEGPGVVEIVEDYQGDAYRAVYTVRFERAVYVLHAFQKKSPKGIKTAKPDVELVRKRLKAARQNYEGTYGKSED